MNNEQFSSIIKLKKQMRRVNRAFYFTRNNNKNKYRFYNGFISVFGYDAYKNEVSADVRNSWDSASNSFDKMFGLLLAWTKSENPERLFDKSENEKQAEERKVTDDNKIKLDSEVMRIRQKTETLKAQYELKKIEQDILNLTKDSSASKNKKHQIKGVICGCNADKKS